MYITPINNNYNPSFNAFEKTFVMLKPDAIKRNLDKKILNEIKNSGVSIVQEWEGIPTRTKMEINYAAHKNKSFFQGWIDFLISGKIKAYIVEGEDAITTMSKVKQAIRNQYAPGEKRFNLMHSSDDVESATREINNFFNKTI